MSDDFCGFVIVFFVIATIAVGFTWIGKDKGYHEGKEAVYLEALEKGFAQRVIDQKTGDTSWEWVGE